MEADVSKHYKAGRHVGFKKYVGHRNHHLVTGTGLLLITRKEGRSRAAIRGSNGDWPDTKRRVMPLRFARKPDAARWPRSSPGGFLTLRCRPSALIVSTS